MTFYMFLADLINKSGNPEIRGHLICLAHAFRNLTSTQRKKVQNIK